jgi:histidinol-phosphate phosphatase family protein
LRRHTGTVLAGTVALGALAIGRKRLARAATAAWAATTAELVAARLRPGPRSADELARIVATSIPMPFAALAWRAKGTLRWARSKPRPWPRPPAAVLLDRDGTLIVDQPYNGDPSAVVPMVGAASALARLRSAGVKLAVVSNQSGLARGLISTDDVAAVNQRIEELLGPLGPWIVCPHGPEDGCDCRKPAPGLVLAAAERLGVAAPDCAVIGDIGADVDAATAAGARSVLVPALATRVEERRAAPAVAADLSQAVDLLLGARS